MNDKSEFSSQSREVLNRYELCGQFLVKGFVPFIPEYDAGVDFMLYREKDDSLLKVQLKSRWSVDRKYFGRNIWIAFPESGNESARAWFVVPHDLMVQHGKAKHSKTESWLKGIYHKPNLSADLLNVYKEFAIDELVKLNKTQLNALTEGSASEWN